MVRKELNVDRLGLAHGERWLKICHGLRERAAVYDMGTTKDPDVTPESSPS